MTSRRRFLLQLTGASAAGLMHSSSASDASGAPGDSAGDEPRALPQVGCLVDTTLCIGCRQCERACARANDNPAPHEGQRREVFRARRRMSADAFTVVNEHSGSPSPVQRDKATTYVKSQCMHCLDPACVSACIVGALSSAPDGAVVYDAGLCIGCRYCMVACPFGVPAYEYDDTLMPRVRKCTFCADPAAGSGANPSCAAACPTEAIVFGARDALLGLARHRIEEAPARYLDRVYGEDEVGGTAWLYLLGRPALELGLLELPEQAPPRLTEAIQHGIFRYGAAPLALYGALGALMWFKHRQDEPGRELAHGQARDEEEGG